MHRIKNISYINIDERSEVFYIGQYFPKNKGIKDAFSDLIIRYKKGDLLAVSYFESLVAKFIYNYFWFCDIILPVPPSTSMLDIYPNKILCSSLSSLNVIPFKDGVLKRQKGVRAFHLANKRDILRVIGSIIISDPEAVKNKNILLFDDIITSGKTSEIIKNMLLKNGARSVVRFFLAKTV